MITPFQAGRLWSAERSIEHLVKLLAEVAFTREAPFRVMKKIAKAPPVAFETGWKSFYFQIMKKMKKSKGKKVDKYFAVLCFICARLAAR